MKISPASKTQYNRIEQYSREIKVYVVPYEN
jgi:hypothetical protein